MPPPKPRPDSPKKETIPQGIDFEVEAKLLQVERDVMREVHEELSNAEKAAIAEKRAKAMIEAYHARSGKPGSAGGVRNLNNRQAEKPLPKPSFVPKLNRLRQLPGYEAPRLL